MKRFKYFGEPSDPVTKLCNTAALVLLPLDYRVFVWLTSRSDSSFLSFKMCFALTARYDEQGFIYPHNQFHIVLDSQALAGLLHSVSKPLKNQ